MQPFDTRCTFDRFLASAVDHADVREAFPDEFPRDLFSDPVPARVYLAHPWFYLLKMPGAGSGSQWVFPYAHEIDGEYYPGLPEKLLLAERELYLWYAYEQADDAVRAYLADLAEHSQKPRADDTLDSLQSLYVAFNAFHGLKLGPCHHHLEDEGLSPAQRSWLAQFQSRWQQAIQTVTPRADQPFVALA